MAYATTHPAQTRAPLPPGVTCFDPDAEDDAILDALIGAETVSDVPGARRNAGPLADGALQLAIDTDPVSALAKVIAHRMARDLGTSDDMLMAFGFSRAVVQKHRQAATHQALYLVATERVATTERMRDDDALTACLLCAHADQTGDDNFVGAGQ